MQVHALGRGLLMRQPDAGPPRDLGRIGRFSNPPPQFGQTLWRCVSTQSAQNVHS
jgi:hypothetical protein